MVIKGSARGSPGQLATHLERTDTNEKMRVVEQRGVAAKDLAGALKEMDAIGAALRTDRTLYHASINTRADEHMTPAQWTAAIDRLEERLGFSGQPRVVVEHAKEGREHVHVVWARTDLEHMRAIRVDHNYRTHEEVARELEREFGHARVQGAHAERDGQKRPDRTPSHAEMQQAERNGLRPAEAKAEITDIWRRTDSGPAFAAALEEAGWILAKGDRRDFVVIDSTGEVHSLTRRVDGVKASDIRARMADVDRESLPRVSEAREMQEARQLERDARIDPELYPPTPEAAPQRAAEPQQSVLQMEREPPVPAPAREPDRSPAMTGGDGLFHVLSDLTSVAIHDLSYIGSEIAKEARFVVAELNGPQSLAEFAHQEIERRGDEPPARTIAPADFINDPSARRDYYAQQANINEDRSLKPDDVRALSRQDLEGVREKGDGYLVGLIATHEQEHARTRDQEHARDR
jgi:hypothetical protein